MTSPRLTSLSFALVLSASLLAQSPEPTPAFPGQTDAPAPAKPSPAFNVETIASGLTGAWAVAFLPDGNFLITQNGGTMRDRQAERLRVGADCRRAGCEGGGGGRAARPAARPRFRSQPDLYFTYFAPPPGEPPGAWPLHFMYEDVWTKSLAERRSPEDRHGEGGARPPQRGQQPPRRRP